MLVEIENERTVVTLEPQDNTKLFPFASMCSKAIYELRIPKGMTPRQELMDALIPALFAFKHYKLVKDWDPVPEINKLAEREIA